jgi:hypothetical protein
MLHSVIFTLNDTLRSIVSIVHYYHNWLCVIKLRHVFWDAWYTSSLWTLNKFRPHIHFRCMCDPWNVVPMCYRLKLLCFITFHKWFSSLVKAVENYQKQSETDIYDSKIVSILECWQVMNLKYAHMSIIEMWRKLTSIIMQYHDKRAICYITLTDRRFLNKQTMVHFAASVKRELSIPSASNYAINLLQIDWYYFQSSSNHQLQCIVSSSYGTLHAPSNNCHRRSILIRTCNGICVEMCWIA